MQDALGIVVFVVVILAAIIAVAGLAARSKAYDEIGRGGLSIEKPPPERPVAAVQEAEIRDMVEAANARRARRGEPPRDVDAEIARLKQPIVDPALEAEVRALVVARNARRERKGQPPLDVETEVRRQLDALG
jgi:hypothetical protein